MSQNLDNRVYDGEVDKTITRNTTITQVVLPMNRHKKHTLQFEEIGSLLVHIWTLGLQHLVITTWIHDSGSLTD